jgi:hypothetical protein
VRLLKLLELCFKLLFSLCKRLSRAQDALDDLRRIVLEEAKNFCSNSGTRSTATLQDSR